MRAARPALRSLAWLGGALALAGAALPTRAAEAATRCTAIADAVSGKVLRQEGECSAPVTPASTFKIALSLMGYDSGFLTDEHLPALPFHEDYVGWNPAWRTTIDPTSWIRYSVVWYSQQLTEWLGPERFRHYVEAFHYGNQDVSGDPGKNNGLTHAWLSSSLRISPLEELAFVHRIIARELPVSARAYEMTSRLTLVGVLPGGWEVHGKTGSGSRVRPDGTVDRSRQVGWFVGWAVRGKRVLAFARCIQSDVPANPGEAPPASGAGPNVREDLLRDLPGLIDAL